MKEENSEENIEIINYDLSEINKDNDIQFYSLNIEDPKLLQVLEDERERMGFFSICQTLHHLVIQASTPPSDKVAEEVSSLFKDNNRADNYKPLEYGERTVAKQHHTPDSITQHPRYNRDKLLPKT